MSGLSKFKADTYGPDLPRLVELLDEQSSMDISLDSSNPTSRQTETTQKFIRSLHMEFQRQRSKIVPLATPKVYRPPGSKLVQIARLFGPKTRNEVLLPAISDLQEEYFEALAEYSSTGETSDLWIARWTRTRGYFSVLAATLAVLPTSFLKWIWQHMKP